VPSNLKDNDWKMRDNPRRWLPLMPSTDNSVTQAEITAALDPKMD